MINQCDIKLEDAKRRLEIQSILFSIKTSKIPPKSYIDLLGFACVFGIAAFSFLVIFFAYNVGRF